MERLIGFDWAIKHVLRDKANFEILDKEIREAEENIRKLYEERIELRVMAGTRDAQASVLVRQLERRFGTLPEQYRERLFRSDFQEIGIVADKIFESQNVDEVFAGMKVLHAPFTSA